jgi:hypothetical protein
MDKNILGCVTHHTHTSEGEEDEGVALETDETFQIEMTTINSETLHKIN